ncbi:MULTISPECIES: Na+/H+ antiporter subunit C [Stappiaceae]|jgi:multicomponent Na+:H+ antiporter subunit C|uniref:Multiple resistance and pH homeostasis protein C n=2 Tax=Roseibium alexandrii TaxID=388408 RepID=A0A0M6ZYR3_9HYPH|nr:MULTISPECIES: Na+/H+ antiporter subunit C [Stappiaceae]OJJ11203.1 cation:proton antiporter [Alphaproteobacteria bacterium AO1-B]EEE44835.1 Multisubunit Na+/H+ antiporter, MnhC subunit [Roseibium alexandrii DFL-11]MBO9419739.1 Na+/H+ antiporter subunit C [Labrenzia sp. R4_2]MBO9425112.1 Na+/H+ antiporter subunit C [Labrenzia sp. R4_1]CTQ67789.1 Multiple resistance and pH homeostasis protein C [Roseibium alexandrii]
METGLSILVGLFFAVSVYLMLSKQLVRMLLGIAILGNAVNMSIFVNGRLTREVPPVIPEGLMVPTEVIANPLPQALVLTAIVISFSFFAFLLVLAFRAYQEVGTDDVNEMRVAEPENDPLPPQGY